MTSQTTPVPQCLAFPRRTFVAVKGSTGAGQSISGETSDLSVHMTVILEKLPRPYAVWYLLPRNRMWIKYCFVILTFQIKNTDKSNQWLDKYKLSTFDVHYCLNKILKERSIGALGAVFLPSYHHYTMQWQIDMKKSGALWFGKLWGTGVFCGSLDYNWFTTFQIVT